MGGIIAKFGWEWGVFSPTLSIIDSCQKFSTKKSTIL